MITRPAVESRSRLGRKPNPKLGRKPNPKVKGGPMIFDEFVVDAPNIAPVHLGSFREDMRSRVVFSIEDSLRNFVDWEMMRDAANDDEPVPALVSPLPFDDIALCFTNAVVAVTALNHSNGWPAYMHIVEVMSFLKGKPPKLVDRGDGELLRINTTHGSYRNWTPMNMVTVLAFDEAGSFLGESTTAGFNAAFDEHQAGRSLPSPDVRSTTGEGRKSALMLHHRAQDLINRFLMFLSCTNIRTIDVVPTSKEQRKRRQIGRPPLVSYKTLQLQPKAGGGGGDSKNLWTNRVHLCRGHFATYTDAAPLFGKYVGRFWIPPHARGRADRGIVNKEYAVSPTDFPQ